MSYKFEHEKNDKSLKVDGFDNGINDIKFEKNKKPENEFFEEPKETLDEDDIGAEFITNESKKIPEDHENESFNEINDEDSQNEDPMMNQNFNDESENESEASAPRLSYEETQQQKAYYLSQLKRLTDKGNVPSRRFGYEHSLNEIKQEVLRIRKEIEINRGVNYCKQGLMFCVSTIEMLNTKYDPFSVDLDGWSNVIMADKESYNDVFEELYEKYSSKITTSPEIKLIMMVAGSAMMFHLQKTIINKQFSSGGGGGGGMLGSLIDKLSGGGNKSPEASKSSENKEQKMKGPSVDTDELLKKLNSDDFSDVSSVTSEVKESKKDGKTISVSQPKKRGRKPKNSK